MGLAEEAVFQRTVEKKQGGCVNSFFVYYYHSFFFFNLNDLVGFILLELLER